MVFINFNLNICGRDIHFIYIHSNYLNDFSIYNLTTIFLLSFFHINDKLMYLNLFILILIIEINFLFTYIPVYDYFFIYISGLVYIIFIVNYHSDIMNSTYVVKINSVFLDY